MLTVFTVSAGYGVTLPLLPRVIERLIGSMATKPEISRHTGLLAAIYLLSLVLFAPPWGRLSDRIGRPRVLLIGLAGFAMTMAGFSFWDHLWAVYSERFFSGAFAAAITPVATALVGDVKIAEHGRAKRLTMVSLAAMAGFLLGPMLGVFITRVTSGISGATALSGSLAAPLRATALLAALALLLVWIGTYKQARSVANDVEVDTNPLPRNIRRALLQLTFLVSAGVGVFEMDLALRGEGELGLSPYQVALMFTECSLVMIVAQLVGFGPAIKPTVSRWIISMALILLAVGLVITPYATSYPIMLGTVAIVSGSAGILAPILTYWITMGAGKERGSELGRQTAASSLGGALGSFMGGFLVGISPLPNSSFILVSIAALLAGFLSFRLFGGLQSSRIPLQERNGATAR